MHSTKVNTPPGLSTGYKWKKKQDSNQVPTNRTNMNKQRKSYIVVPYYSGLSESIKKIGKMFGVQVYF